MSDIQKIITYFFHHSFSKDMIDRVHRRMMAEKNEKEQDEACFSLWEEIGFPEDERRSEEAFKRLQRRLDLPGPKPALSLFSKWARIAALWILPLVLLVSSIYMYKDASTIRHHLAQVSMIEHFVPVGKREMVTLPDSSRVWLNSGSVLVYPSAFFGDRREVYLSGEGYFEVEGNREKPFIVNVRTLGVEVLGTRFDVWAYPESQEIKTTLEQGSVQVRLNEASDRIYQLKPNEQLVYHVNNKEVDVRQVRSADYSDWRSGGLFFDNASFRDVIRTIERNYGVTVHLHTSVYNDNRLTIHFKKDESLENIFMLLKELIPGLEYQIAPKDVYLD